MNFFQIFISILFLSLTLMVVMFKPQIIKPVKIVPTKYSVLDKKTPSSEDKATSQAWNKWQENIANNIVNKMGAPSEFDTDEIVYIGFKVDRYKNITNIKISSSSEKQTKIAQKYFFEYINSLNGNDILQFPEGSDKKIADFSATIEFKKETNGW